jgi:hypothetical protein
MAPKKSALPGPASVATGRSEGSRELMKLAWDYPVFVATEAPKSEGTAVKAARKALPREDAIRHIAGKDPRPLLVLRECPVCERTDDALLSKDYDNEKTLILSRWFHCVKLPTDVIKSDHPFNALFPDDETEHLFVADVDGAGRMPLESDTSRVELNASMTQVLARAYAADPMVAYKEIVRHLDRIDALDGKARDLELKKTELMETVKIDPAKVKKVDAEVTEIKAQIATERGEIEKLSKLELKPAGAAVAPSAPGKADR